MELALSQLLIHWIFEHVEGSIPFTCSTSPHLILNGLQLRSSCEHSVFHKVFNFESYVHASIIDFPKGIATVAVLIKDYFFLRKLFYIIFISKIFIKNTVWVFVGCVKSQEPPSSH